MLLNWSAFITTHPDSVKLSTDAAAVVNILASTVTPLTRDMKVAKLSAIQSTPSTIVLTLHPFENRVHHTFLHQPFGLDFAGTAPVKCIALCGLGSRAIPVFLDCDSLLSRTDTAIACPSVTDFMALHGSDLAGVTALTATANNNHHVNHAAVLPPILSSIITNDPTISSPAAILLAFIQTIHATRPADADEEDDVTYAAIYHPILITLWGFINHSTIADLHTLSMPGSCNDGSAWAARLHHEHLLPEVSVSDDSSRASSNSSSLLNKLADSLNRTPASSIRFASAPEDTKEDDKTKAWRKLDAHSKQGILFASTPDGLTVPQDPTDQLLQVIACKNGAAVIRLFLHWFKGLDIVIQPGMATNLCKGIFTSVPDPFAVNTFSPFFTPPARAGFCNTSNDELNLLELSSSTLNLSEARCKQMTTSKPFLDLNPQFFLPTLKNYEAILKTLFSEDALITIPVTDVITEYTNDELHFHRCFEQNKFFGIWLMDRVHFHQQSILHACHSATNIENIQFMRHNMQHELKEIKMMCHRVTIPTWCKKEVLAGESRHNNIDNHIGGGGSPPGKNRNNLGSPNGKRVKIENTQIDPGCGLKTHETYSDLVKPDVVRACTSLSVKLDGAYVCNNFHIKGACHSRCIRKGTHTPLTGETKTKFRAYVAALRTKAKELASTHPQNTEGET